MSEDRLLALAGEKGTFPMRYLGVGLKPTKWNKSYCSCIIEKINKVASCWGSWHLSFAGRAQLVSPVIFGIRSLLDEYFFSATSAIKTIDQICRRYLWGDEDGKRKIHTMAWDKVCLPKSHGGIGFKEGSRWNKPSLGKFLFLKKDSLWLRWVHSFYIKANDFLIDPLKGDSSWYWKKLLKLRSILPFSSLQSCTVNGQFSLSKC